MPTQYIIIGVLALALAALFIWVVLMARRLKIFFQGKEARDLEEYINQLTKRTEKLESEKENLNKQVKVLQEKMTGSVRGVSSVRFNPFKDAGGNQSFAVALLDESGNGVVLSSLYAREKTSVFAKPVSKFNSEYELSTEEKEAVEKAKVK